MARILVLFVVLAGCAAPMSLPACEPGVAGNGAPAAAIACRLQGLPHLATDVRGIVDDRALFTHEGSLAWAASVDYGPWCPDEAINTGRQWDAWVLVDAHTQAVVHTSEGRWNCIGVPSPMAAVATQ